MLLPKSLAPFQYLEASLSLSLLPKPSSAVSDPKILLVPTMEKFRWFFLCLLSIMAIKVASRAHTSTKTDSPFPKRDLGVS